MAKHFKQKNKMEIILSFLILIFLIGIIISTTHILKWIIDNKKNKELTNDVSKAITIGVNEEKSDIFYNINFEELKNINNEVIAWLKVNGTNIEYAVVKTEDNSYYLNHNLEKKHNNAGWIFADYKNKFDGTDKNIVIYGHNRKDNSMFATLKNVLTEEWLSNQENYIINLVTESEQQKYQVFSVYQIENEDYYINAEFNNGEFEMFINNVKNRSIKDFNIEVSAEDKILTLSTCANNNRYRVVLHAKKISG